MPQRRLRRYARLLCVFLLAAFVLAWAAPAFAAEDETVPPDKLDADELERRLFAKPLTAVLLVLFRFVPVVAGVALAVLYHLKQEKIRHGMLPAPQRVEPTTPFNLGGALVVIGIAFVAANLVVIVLSQQHGWKKAADIPVWAQLVGVSAGSIPAALVVILRRSRLAQAPAAPAAPRPGLGAVLAPPPGAPVHPAPHLGRAILIGLWGLCIASMVFIPVAMGWALLLREMGADTGLQTLVTKMLDPAHPEVPWLITGFGVLVAPFTEEALFRGMLYPALKGAFGGGNRGAWIGAVLSSAAFAMVHDSWIARIPLFVLAMVLARLFERTNSLAAVTVVHALHNLFSTVPILLL